MAASVFKKRGAGHDGACVQSQLLGRIQDQGQPEHSSETLSQNFKQKEVGAIVQG